MVVIAVLAALAGTLWLTSRMTTIRCVGPLPLVCLEISTDVAGEQKEQWATERRSGSCKGGTVKHKKEIGGSPCGMYTDLYHSLVCINKVLNRSTRFHVTLQRFCRQDRYHFLYFNHTESNKRKLLFDNSTTLNQRTEEGKLLFDISTDYRFRQQ